MAAAPTPTAADSAPGDDSAAKKPSSLLLQLRAIIAGRLLLCDTLAGMDLQLRSQQAETSRTAAALAASRQAEAVLEASVAALRRQIDVLRAELAANGDSLASSGDALSAAQERGARAEADAGRLNAELQKCRAECAETVGLV